MNTDRMPFGNGHPVSWTTIISVPMYILRAFVKFTVHDLHTIVHTHIQPIYSQRDRLKALECVYPRT